MRNILVLLISCVVSIQALGEQELWIKFKEDHSRNYTNSDETHRYKVFQENLLKIQEHNARYAEGKETYYQGINEFADLTNEEFKKRYLTDLLPKSHSGEHLKIAMNVTLADSVDWRDKGVVLPVRDQGLRCRSCWAFAALAVVESQKAIKYGIKEELSPQELVDCAGFYGGNGCRGGYMENGYEYMMDHGVSLDNAYPYLARDDICRNSNTPRARVRVVGFRLVEQDNEEALKYAVATYGPVAVGIISDQIQFYQGGIYDNVLCTGILNHAVVVVGYGTQNNNDFWIVKNTWGVRWGESGYIRMSRNKLSQCGIAAMPSFPIIQ